MKNKIKNTIFLTMLLGIFIPPTANGQQPTAKTRAVIIGISDYQETLIPDLNYADRDAQAFANWLRSPAGGSVPEQNILLHTNEAATNAEMIMSLDWLIDASKKGDRAFIYFSGHGDVERVTNYNNGYLLGYDSPPAVYGAGAFAVDYLKAMISSLSENGVQVFLITDACRAGKLAGSSANGSQVTAARLSQQFAKEIKILSCQPDEFSLEGEQWGGGRGLFSYHLENALYGFADQNEDLQINLLELGRYLQDKVSSEADPESQIPMVQGPPKEKIAFVNDEVLAQRRADLGSSSPEFLAIDNKGLEEMILADLDTNLQIVYEQFLTAIDSNFLMAPEGSSANDYYETLMASAEMKKLHGTVKRKFVVALMDEGQKVINKILRTDPQMLNNLWLKKVRYNHLPSYFNRAAEVLGEKHYAYNSIKAKAFFFEARSYRKVNYPDSLKEWRAEKRKIALSNSILYDSTMALSYADLAFQYHYRTVERDSLLKKAIAMAPNSALIHLTLSDHYRLTGFYEYMDEATTVNYEKSINHAKKAIQINPDYLFTYYSINEIYSDIGHADSSLFFLNLYVEKINEKHEHNSQSKLNYTECLTMSNAMEYLGRWEEAKEYALLAEKKSEGKAISHYWQMGEIFLELQEFENAIKSYQKVMALGGYSKFINSIIGTIYYIFLKDFEKAGKEFENLNDITHLEAHTYDVFRFHYLQNDLDSALYYLDTFGIQYPKFYYFDFYKGEVNKKLGNHEKALQSYRFICNDAKLTFKPKESYFPNYFF